MNKTSRTHTLQVQGLRCGHCDMAITNAVTEQDPGAQVQIDRSNPAVAQVRIVSHLDADALQALIEAEGYAVVA